DRTALQAELVQAVAMARLVSPRALLLRRERVAELRRHREAELLVDALDRGERLGDQLAVVDDRMLRLRMPREHLERMAVGVQALRREHVERPLHARVVPVVEAP